MMYALNVNTENRILSACIVLPITPETMPRVDSLPDGNINDYLFVNGEYVYDPVPTPEPPEPTPEPTVEELINIILGVAEYE